MGGIRLDCCSTSHLFQGLSRDYTPGSSVSEKMQGVSLPCDVLNLAECCRPCRAIALVKLCTATALLQQSTMTRDEDSEDVVLRATCARHFQDCQEWPLSRLLSLQE